MLTGRRNEGENLKKHVRYIRLASICPSQQGGNSFYLTALFHHLPDPTSDARSCLYRVDVSGNRFKAKLLFDANTAFPDRSAIFNCMCADSAGNIHIGDDQCAIQLNGATFDVKDLLHAVHGTLLSAYSPQPGHVLHGTSDGWIAHLHGEHFSKHKVTPAEEDDAWNPVNAIHGLSPEFIVAVGDEGLLAKWNGQAWTNLNTPTSSNLRSVWCQSEHDVFVGAESGHVWLWDGAAHWQPVRYDWHGPVERLMCLQFAAHEGVLYAACGDEGVFRLDGTTLTHVTGTKFVASLASTHIGLMGVAGKWGKDGNWLTRFDGKQWTSQKIRPRYPAEDAEGS